jgi:hypothetical protein
MEELRRILSPGEPEGQDKTRDVIHKTEKLIHTLEGWLANIQQKSGE